jgi:hypothetical protein
MFRPLQIVLNPYLLLSLTLYRIATVFWVLLLRDTELSKAYLVVALSIVLWQSPQPFCFENRYLRGYCSGPLSSLSDWRSPFGSLNY